MTPTRDPPATHPSTRFLLTKRAEDLEAESARLDAQLAETAETREELRRRTHDSEKRWRALLEHLERLDPDELENGFRNLSRFQADLAAVDERCSDAGARLIDLRSEQEVLRSVYRSLDDLAASRTQPDKTGVRSVSRHVFQIIEEERTRIARDMHDGPAQSMANLVIQAEIIERLIRRDPQLAVQELADFKEGVSTVLEDSRRLIGDLRPVSLDDLGLVPSLRRFIREFGETAGVDAHVRVTGEDIRLPGSLEPIIFWIVQEALDNVRTHARARTVQVLINFEPDGVSLVIRDDGVGMDVAAVQARLDPTKHLGLVAMRHGAQLEKGILEILSEGGRGSEVRVAFNL